jgi:hypothetical protein
MKKQLLEDIRDIAIIGGSASLFIRGLSNKEPGDLDLLCTIENFNPLRQVLSNLGFTFQWHIRNQRGFHPNAKYVLDDLKVDIFIVPENIPHGWIGENKYVEPEVVWAARAFYAAKGFEKASKQLVEGGFWLQAQADNAYKVEREFTSEGL